MRFRLFTILVLFLLFKKTEAEPNLLSLNTSATVDTIANKDSKKIIQSGNKALNSRVFSVVNKTGVAASGNKNDYYSLAPYFWPDRKKKDGLPYIRKDGEINPETRTDFTDYKEWNTFSDAVSALTKAYQLTNDKKYAVKSKDLINAWFIDPKTAMNPNLDYAQGIRGVNDGRQFGIIEFGEINNVMECVSVLKENDIVDEQYERQFKHWITEYANWLENSKLGKLEANTTNNHGTTYDVQLSKIFIYLNEKEKLINLLEKVKTRRIAVQIAPDGKQPEELIRTKAFSYSLLNLGGLTQLAILGKKYGVDLWNYKNPKGGSIQKAYDFLVPYLEQEWPYKQIASLSDSKQKLVKMLALVGKEFDDQHYRAIAKSHQTESEKY